MKKEGASLVAQTVKNLPAMQETWVWSVDWEDPLEKGMATHSSILAWKIPWTEESGGLHSLGLQRVGHDWVTNTHTWRKKHRYSYFLWKIKTKDFFLAFWNFSLHKFALMQDLHYYLFFWTKVQRGLLPLHTHTQTHTHTHKAKSENSIQYLL